MNDIAVINNYPNKNCSLLYWYVDCGDEDTPRGWHFAVAYLGNFSKFHLREAQLKQALEDEGLASIFDTEYLRQISNSDYERIKRSYAAS